MVTSEIEEQTVYPRKSPEFRALLPRQTKRIQRSWEWFRKRRLAPHALLHGLQQGAPGLSKPHRVNPRAAIIYMQAIEDQMLLLPFCFLNVMIQVTR